MTKQYRPIAPLVLVTVGLAVALGLRPISVREILAAYVLALAAIALLALTRLAHTEDAWERATSELERALTPVKAVRTRPAELIRVERDIVLGTTNAGHFHARLLPQLREVASARLAARRDVDLAHARELLGDDAWELLRPDRPAPADRSERLWREGDAFEPGLPLRRIALLLDAIERL